MFTLKYPSCRANQYISIVQKISSYSFPDNNPPPRVGSILISITIDQFLPIPELHANGNILYSFMSGFWHLIPHNHFEIHPFDGCICGLFILLLVDIQVVASLLPMMNRSFMNILVQYIFGDITFIPLGKIPTNRIAVPQSGHILNFIKTS